MSANPIRGKSTRAILRRVLRVVERMEHILSAGMEYMTAALDSLDVQMNDLKTRLQQDADALREAIANANLAQEQEAALVAAADRVQATAVAVSGLAQPSAVADPDQPDVGAGPLEPETPETPETPEQPTPETPENPETPATPGQ